MAEVIAVPVMSLNLRSTSTIMRLESITRDSGAKLILSTNSVFAFKEHLSCQAPVLASIQWNITDETRFQRGEPLITLPTISADSIAFLQYTSGSTGAPKGVMVTHSNLMNNLQMIKEAFNLKEKTKAVSWLPLYHDMGLIGSILEVVYAKMTLYLFSPLDFIRNPVSWLYWISKTGAAVSGGPNFAYDLCVKQIDRCKLEELDLSRWEVAFNGAEAVRYTTLRRFAETFASCGFRGEAFQPCYGLAEATLMVSCEKTQHLPDILHLDRSALSRRKVEVVFPSEKSTNLVSSGYIRSGIRVSIIDPGSDIECAADEIGEICLMGPSICRGYWNRPQETGEVFKRGSGSFDEEAFLRTGDLGFINEGRLYITSRLKDLIVIRGKNHYPDDIESTVKESHKELKFRNLAAFSVDRNNKENLILGCGAE